MKYQGNEFKISIPRACGTTFNLTGKQWGQEGGLPVLALHGWLDNAGSFDYLAPLLKNVNLFALDSPGHGLSDHFDDRYRPHFLDSVEMTIQAIKALEFDSIAILGHSLGAAVGSVVAAVLPKQITHLALLDGIGPLTRAPEATTIQLQHAIKHMLRGYRPATRYPSKKAAISARQRSGGLSEQAAIPLFERGTRSVDDGYIWYFDRKMQIPSLAYFCETQVANLLENIQVHTCFIQATQGIFANNNLAAQRTRLVPSIETHQVVGHHHVHLENPQPIADIINNYFAKSGTTSP